MAQVNTQKEAMLSLEALRSVLRYDADAGLFWWLVPALRRDLTKPAGWSNGNGYLSVRIGKQRYLLSRLAWFMTHGTWPSGEIDHINRNKQDNRIANLRVVTRQQNCVNVGPRSAIGLFNISAGSGWYYVNILREGRVLIHKKYKRLCDAIISRNTIMLSLNGGRV